MMKAGVQPKSGDDQIIRRPADRPGEVFEILAHGRGDVQPAGIVVAAQEQDPAPVGSFMGGEAAHHGDPRIQVAPSFHVCERDVELGADEFEQVSQMGPWRFLDD